MRTQGFVDFVHSEFFTAMAKVGSAAMFKGLPSSRIWKQQARLNQIAGSPSTAFKFDPKYTKVELLLIEKSVLAPAFGLRRFWRQNLPTLKFHNDNVDFVLTRIATKTKEDLAKCPTKIVLHLADGSTQELDCSNKNSSKILKELVKVTGATPVPEEEIPVLKNGDSEYAV